MKNGEIRHFKIPTGTYQSAKQLEKGIHFGIIRELDRQIDFIGLEAPEDKQEPQPKRTRRTINIIGHDQLENANAQVPTLPQNMQRQPAQQSPIRQQGPAQPPIRQQGPAQQSPVRQQAPTQPPIHQQGAAQQQPVRQQGPAQQQPVRQSGPTPEQLAKQRADEEEQRRLRAVQLAKQRADEEEERKRRLRAEQQLREFSKEIAWLRERNEWTYAQTLQEYLLKYRSEVLITSSNLQAHIHAHADEFRRLYRLVEEGIKTPFGHETARQLMEYAKKIKLNYNEVIGRFEVEIGDKSIDRIELTPQISYVLGFQEGRAFRDGDQAKYAPDLRGSVSHLCVYMSSGAIEEIIVGHTLSNLLQIVAVEGQNGDIIQKEFQHPLMHRIVAREIDTLEFEIRSLDGRLVNFEFGTVVLTILFKKSIYF